MIKIENVWHHYGIRPILKNISLSIEAGELVAVMGPNGMGKSTLLSIMAGVLSPIQGSVQIDGLIRRSSIDNEIKIRKKVYYLPDQAFLPPTITGKEFLLAVGRIYEVDEFRLMQHSDQLLELFDLAEQANSLISSYSTGQKKKISICSALITEAPVLILDEPFSGGLDSSALHALNHIFKQMAKSQQSTVVMAVPVPELVEPLAHKIAIIADGEVIAYDTADGLRHQTKCSGSLSEVLEALINPQVVKNLENYLQKH